MSTSGQPSRAVKAIPDGFRTITPHLVVKGASEAIDLYVLAFGAKVRDRNLMPDGRVMHAELQIGDSILFVVDDFPEMSGGKPKHPLALGGSTVSIHLYVEDCDAWTARATKAGFTLLMGPMDAFWGDRFAMLRDRFGHEWTIGTHNRDLTKEQMEAEMAKMGGG